jgi:YD repeat-containing protein
MNDLSPPRSGVGRGGDAAITVRRVYDSQNANVLGDFGYGWSLDVSGTDLHSTARPGSGNRGSGNTFRPGDVLYLTLPGGQQHAFQFLPVPTNYHVGGAGSDPYGGFGVYDTYWIQFVCVDGSNATLTVPSDVHEPEVDRRVSLIYDRDHNEFYAVTGESQLAYDPTQGQFGNEYTVRTVDGTLYSIDATTGQLTSTQDPNGNLTRYDGDSIKENGLTLKIERNGPQGSISKIYLVDSQGGMVGNPVTDPYGNVTHNTYDADGNLSSSTSRYGTPDAETTYFSYTNGVDYPYVDGTVGHYADPTDPTDPKTPHGLLLETWQVRTTGGAPTVLSKSVYYTPTDVADGVTGALAGKLESSTDVAGVMTFYTYNSDGTPDATYHLWTDPTPGSTTQRWVWSEDHYDGDGRVTATDSAVYARLSGDGPNPVTDPSRLVYDLTRSVTHYDAAGQQDWTETQYYWRDGSGKLQLAATQDHTAYHYDLKGNLVETLYADGTATRSVYDATGRVTWATDRFAVSSAAPVPGTQTIYDSLGRAY